MTFNGWKNYETWNVALWINNEERLYRAMRAARPFTRNTAEAFCRDVYPNGTPDMREEGAPNVIGRSRMNLVDWQEVANKFNAD